MNMEIVVLDGYGLNPGDLSWEPFKEIGNVTVYDRTVSEDVIERSKDAEDQSQPTCIQQEVPILLKSEASLIFCLIALSAIRL